MPGDESDGCEPDVSPFEIASQSWDTFNNLYEETHDRQWLRLSGHGRAACPSLQAAEHDRPELEDSHAGHHRPAEVRITDRRTH